MLGAGLDWREVSILRGYAKYLRQAGLPLSQDYLERALNACAPMGVNVEVKNSPGDLSDAPYGHEVVDRVLELSKRNYR